MKFLFFLLIFYGALPVFALTANEVLDRVEAASSPPSEIAELKMVIREPDGSNKERELTIKKVINKSGTKALVRIHSPADLKGVGFLSIQSSSGDEEQWLYLPSTKRKRRILGSGKGGRFLDSDLTYEDMSASTYKSFRNKIKKTTKKGKDKVVVIESRANKGSESSYKKIMTWVSLKDYRIIKSEYYNRRNKKVKTMKFSNYKLFKKKYWRAQKVQVVDNKNKRSTLLKLSNLKLRKIADSEFSKTALEDY